MGRMPTDALLDRFLTGLLPLDPVAVWAHGSLGAGDYQEGRSDLDLVAVLPRPATARTAWRLGLLHARLRAEPWPDCCTARTCRRTPSPTRPCGT